MLLRSLLVLPFLFTAGCVIALDLNDEDRHALRHRHDREQGLVSGRVVEASGSPVRARVAAVYASGSYSHTSDSQGGFRLGPLPEGRFNLKATTDDGRIGLLEGLELGGDESLAGLELALEQGATLELSFEGGSADSYRCALFHGGARVDDFTLRRGETATVVVPAGRVPAQLYTGKAVWAAGEAELTPGQRSTLVFRLD